MNKFLECHQYEPKQENFESCNVTVFGLRAVTKHGLKCKYNTLDHEASLAYAKINVNIDTILEDEVCNLPNKCTAQCFVLQDGNCLHLSVDEIKVLLDKTDWIDEDKGETLTPYILREAPNQREGEK